MIRIHRTGLPSDLQAHLEDRAQALHECDAKPKQARTAWKNARKIRGELTGHLSQMAPGIRRCMYCGDSYGTDIDHFEPLAQAPLRAFDWPNHLLACSYCNSNVKRELFPRDADGDPMLIDPSTEDPYVHLELALSTGTYEALTPRGQATIDVFGLNRHDLNRGRAAAFIRTRCMARDHLKLLAEDRADEAAEVAASLREQPFADVLYAMLRYREFPGALRVLRDPDLLEALADPALNFWDV